MNRTTQILQVFDPAMCCSTGVCGPSVDAKLVQFAARKVSDLPEEVRSLMPRLRDGAFTRVVVVTLPEATPVHEASMLQADLRRAQIEPFAWVINQSLAESGSHDPLLVKRAQGEAEFIREVVEQQSKRTALVPWVTEEPAGPERLEQLFQTATVH
jgi:arsenite-transporting ATPase